jgi:hypothetical protein
MMMINSYDDDDNGYDDDDEDDDDDGYDDGPTGGWCVHCTVISCSAALYFPTASCLSVCSPRTTD